MNEVREFSDDED